MNEERLVAWLAARTAGAGAVKLGDDTASLPRMRGNAIVTVDQQIEGVHFVADLDPAIVARRLLAVNLSDLAASGAIPRYAFLALSAPPGFDHRRFFTALLDSARAAGVVLAGGDLARSSTTHFALTLVGERSPSAASLSRDRARPGHRIWLGGTLGESALGRRLIELGARPHGRSIHLPTAPALRGSLRRAAQRAVRRHLSPEPQLALGRWLAALHPRQAGAAIDVSDGFAKDLHRLCAASGVGSRIDSLALESAIPDSFAELCAALDVSPDELVSGGGEDYVLLFTLPLRVQPPSTFGCRALGIVTREPDVLAIDRAGREREISPRGWDHLADAAGTIER